MLTLQWLLTLIVAQAAATGLLGLVVGGLFAQHANRLSNLEWLQTVPLDERIEARERQRAYEEAKVLRNRPVASMPLARRLGGVPSGPMGPVPLDQWAHNGHNGHHELREDAGRRLW